ALPICVGVEIAVPAPRRAERDVQVHAETGIRVGRGTGLRAYGGDVVGHGHSMPAGCRGPGRGPVWCGEVPGESGRNAAVERVRSDAFGGAAHGHAAHDVVDAG